MVYPMFPVVPRPGEALSESPRLLRQGGDRGGVIERGRDGFVNPTSLSGQISGLVRDYSAFRAALNGNPSKIFRIEGQGSRTFVVKEWSERLIAEELWDVSIQVEEVFRP